MCVEAASKQGLAPKAASSSVDWMMMMMMASLIVLDIRARVHRNHVGKITAGLVVVVDWRCQKSPARGPLYMLPCCKIGEPNFHQLFPFLILTLT